MQPNIPDLWTVRRNLNPLQSGVTFGIAALTLGAATVLLRLDRRVLAEGLSPLRGADHDRLTALLAVAAGGRLDAGVIQHIAVALKDWCRGDRGLAAIRLAFAPLPRVDDAGAYRLFLAEQALDAGLSPRALLQELGYAAVATMLKGAVDQPRVPAGSGRISGQWTRDDQVDSDAPVRTGHPATVDVPRPAEPPSVTPVFLDTGRDRDDPVAGKPTILAPNDIPSAVAGGRTLNFAIPKGAPLPFAVPAPDDSKDGPACPAMRPDRARGTNAAGDREEARVAALVNPTVPTPKSTPENPDVTSMAFYLPLGASEVAHDDCKRTNEPTPGIPDLRKGDMVEIKTAGAGAVALNRALRGYVDFEDQLDRLVDSVRAEGLGRRIFVCVGSQQNVLGLQGRFRRGYDEVHFVDCR